jgi:acetyl-CoA synthetase
MKTEMIEGNQVVGSLCIKFPWPGIARTIWGDHQRYKDTYFSAFPGTYFTGDGALDEVGYYRITGRVDDVVIVRSSLGTAPIEDAINEHPAVAESAIVGFPHDIKALYGYVILKKAEKLETRKTCEINQYISDVGTIAKLDKIQFVFGLQNTFW